MRVKSIFIAKLSQIHACMPIWHSIWWAYALPISKSNLPIKYVSVTIVTCFILCLQSFYNWHTDVPPTNQYSVSTVSDQQLPRIILLRTLYHEIQVQLSRLEVPPISWRRRLRLWLNRRKPPMRDYDISQNLSRLSEPAWVKWEPGVCTFYLHRGALSWRARSGLTLWHIHPVQSVRSHLQ